MERYFTCPHCGAQVPTSAAACPECGSDNETGWSEAAAYDDLLLYDHEPPAPRVPFMGIPRTPCGGADSSRHAAWPQYLIVVVAILTLAAYLTYALTWGVYLIPVILAVVGVVIYLTQVLPRQRHSQEKQVYQRLIQRARGDRELVARLIEHERRRSPGAGRLRLMQDVLYYWERDSR